jgi:two-component system, OmpR family, alkaline phosphatase synthesis response regulator PhoP
VSAMESEPVVLVIDDDLAMLELLASVLDDEGYAVRTASGGVQGLNLLEEADPGLVLLDWMMPAMRGDEVLRRIRAGRYSQVPVVILSANGDAKSLIAEGADAFIAKPFDIDDLLNCVASYIGRP